eukprot:6200703-Pleurochrysis_carterae.AAC.1
MLDRTLFTCAREHLCCSSELCSARKQQTPPLQMQKPPYRMRMPCRVPSGAHIHLLARTALDVRVIVQPFASGLPDSLIDYMRRSPPDCVQSDGCSISLESRLPAGKKADLCVEWD